MTELPQPMNTDASLSSISLVFVVFEVRSSVLTLPAFKKHFDL